MDSDTEYMLTTRDNPYSPFTQFELWFKYDMIHGYNSLGLLNETSVVTSVRSDELNEKDVNDAIDYIVNKNPLIYKKVSEQDYD